MPRAIVKNGVFVPVDPMPTEWADGKEVLVVESHETDNASENEVRWLEELNAMVAENDAEDFMRLEEALREADKEAKEWVRREMGLP